MKLSKAIVVLSFIAFSGAAYADPAAPTPAAPAATAPAPAKPAAKPRSAKSIECSKQADSQNLHGKPRKQFMSTCKKS